MLERPDIADAAIISVLHDAYGLSLSNVEFLPLGADANTAVYRANSGDTRTFVKLRRGPFDATSVTVPALLHARGIAQVIAPLATTSGELWARLDAYHVIVYPFIDGVDGFERALSAQHWSELGAALRRIHETPLPSDMARQLPREAYTASYRDSVRGWLSTVTATHYADPIAAEFAAVMQAQADTIRTLAHYAEQLAAQLSAQTLPLLLCHADIHVGNVLLTADDKLFIVDWDTLLLAPKERDLMFAGIGIGPATRFSADEQTALFFRGYGPTEVNRAALAYYRCERIVQDVHEFCAQVLRNEGDSADRQQSLHYFQGQFAPGDVVERAFAALEAI